MTRIQFDRRTLLSIGSVGIAASALGLRAGVAHQDDDHGATPVGGGEASHPAHIHAGTCEELGDVVFPLNDVAAPSADAEATPAASPAAAGAGDVVAESTTEVDASLDDILGTEHAINVHESAENIQNYIACGDLTGPATDGELRVELRELNGSGYTGEARLVDNGDGTTVTVTLMAVGGAAGTPAAASEQGGAAVEVDIQDFAYNPASVTIEVGQSVTWTNQDSAPHTATTRDRDVLQSGTLNQGESYTQTFDTAGTYEYFCEFHTNMKGTVVIQ